MRPIVIAAVVKPLPIRHYELVDGRYVQVHK